MELDPYETCPFDRVHRIRRSRMQFHLTQCSKNFPASKMMQCPFDARHKVNQVEFEYHKSQCPARASVIDYAIHDPALQAEQKILPIDVNPVGMSDENWDEGTNVKTYNPLQAIQDKPIVYSIIGLSKAKRKHHRLQERIRYNQIMENSGQRNANQSENLNSSILKPKLQANQSIDNGEDEEEYKPLRRPHHKPDKKRNLITSEDSKKLSPKVDKTSDISFNSAKSLLKKEKNPILNRSTDNDSIIDKLSRTFEEIVVNDEGHKKKTEQLEKELDMLKRMPSEKKK